MKKLFFIVSLLQLNLLLCMDQENGIFVNTAFSPKTARAIIATLREDPWRPYAPEIIKKDITSKKQLKHFVKTQCSLQKEHKRKNVEEDAQEYGFTVNGWKTTYETLRGGKAKIIGWLSTQLQNTEFFNTIPIEKRQTYIEHVIEEYRKNQPPSDSEGDVEFEKLQEQYKLEPINLRNPLSLRKSSD